MRVIVIIILFKVPRVLKKGVYCLYDYLSYYFCRQGWRKNTDGLIYFRLHLRNAFVVGQNRCTRGLELSQNQLICCLKYPLILYVKNCIHLNILVQMSFIHKKTFVNNSKFLRSLRFYLLTGCFCEKVYIRVAGTICFLYF